MFRRRLWVALMLTVLAVSVVSFIEITLSPAEGAIFMSASTVVVTFNAQLLRRLDVRPVSVPSLTAEPQTAPS